MAPLRVHGLSLCPNASEEAGASWVTALQCPLPVLLCWGLNAAVRCVLCICLSRAP